MKTVGELSLKREFGRFALVGVIGFCIDGGVLTVLMGYGWSILFARCASFSLAVSATWLLNRLWTFDSGLVSGIRREYVSYFCTQLFGAIINLSVFFIFIWVFPTFRDIPLIPLAFGAAISLTFNYMISKKIVFKR